MNNAYKQSFVSLSALSAHFLEPVAWYHLPFTSRFTMVPHKHPQYEIMYCEQGSFTIECFNEKGEVYASTQVSEKSLVLLNNISFHKLTINTADAELMNIELLPVKDLPDDADPLLKKFTLTAAEIFLASPQLGKLFSKNEPFYVFRDSQEVSFTLRKCIRTLLESNHPATEFSIRLLITELFIGISYCWLAETSTPPVLTHVKKALLYIQHNYNKPLSISVIANEIGISPAYLQRLFRAEFGESVHKVITNFRIDKAKKLLRDTSFNNTDIAKLTGFGTRAKLISSIKKSEDCTPQDFRKSVLQKQWAVKNASTTILESTLVLPPKQEMPPSSE